MSARQASHPPPLDEDMDLYTRSRTMMPSSPREEQDGVWPACAAFAGGRSGVKFAGAWNGREGHDGEPDSPDDAGEAGDAGAGNIGGDTILPLAPLALTSACLGLGSEARRERLGGICPGRERVCLCRQPRQFSRRGVGSGRVGGEVNLEARCNGDSR